MSVETLIERHGVVLEEWQWEALEDDLPGRLKAIAKPHTSTFVYFAQEVAGNDAVKIGIAADPKERLATLQTGNPRKLEIKQLVVGDVLVEKRLHRLWGLKGACIHDEWFSKAEKVLTLAEHIACEQIEVLERGRFVERDLKRAIDHGLRKHREILGL